MNLAMILKQTAIAWIKLTGINIKLFRPLIKSLSLKVSDVLSGKVQYYFLFFSEGTDIFISGLP
jgi:hypothetical protein